MYTEALWDREWYFQVYKQQNALAQREDAALDSVLSGNNRRKRPGFAADVTIKDVSVPYMNEIGRVNGFLSFALDILLARRDMWTHASEFLTWYNEEVLRERYNVGLMGHRPRT